ncbi:MAG: hypothetical protein EPN23_08730 [Verrucomicrobia bacterium]|nr:MAG: hypothetical protein EPN23_08730 [Verrucomicrobiota bacterium]
MNLVAGEAALLAARRWPRRLWWLAAPLAVGWFAFWGFLWRPEAYTPPRGLPRFASHARFLPGRATTAGSEVQRDLRVMWSPVLFALPTPMGFSRTPSTGESRDHPRVQRPGAEPLLMSEPCAATNVAVVSAPPLPAFADGVRFRLDDVRSVFADLPVITNALTVELVGDLATIHTLEKTLPALPAELADDSWTVIAYVDVGQAGEVRHVFLDPPSSVNDFNAQLLQALYRWRFTPAAADLHGAIHLHHAAAPQHPQPAPEAAQP